ncbi:MAG: hypothetical protein IPK93_03660 [Solirubrobacterales bacterium]|nr:hypothetical protein [Solirubrobacterales bacterium]
MNPYSHGHTHGHSHGPRRSGVGGLVIAALMLLLLILGLTPGRSDAVTGQSRPGHDSGNASVIRTLGD